YLTDFLLSPCTIPPILHRMGPDAALPKTPPAFLRHRVSATARARDARSTATKYFSIFYPEVVRKAVGTTKISLTRRRIPASHRQCRQRSRRLGPQSRSLPEEISGSSPTRPNLPRFGRSDPASPRHDPRCRLCR